MPGWGLGVQGLLKQGGHNPSLDLARSSPRQVIDAVTDGKYQAILIFILWIFFAPAVWLLTQTELNKLSVQPSETTPTTEVQPAPSEPTSEEGGGDGEAGAEAP